MKTRAEIADLYDQAKDAGELVRLVQVAMHRRYVDEDGSMHTRVFKVTGKVAERRVLAETCCPNHRHVFGFSWESACPVCENST